MIKRVLLWIFDFLIKWCLILRMKVSVWGIKFNVEENSNRGKPAEFTPEDAKVINRFLDENGYPKHLHISKQKNDNA